LIVLALVVAPVLLIAGVVERNQLKVSVAAWRP